MSAEEVSNYHKRGKREAVNMLMALHGGPLLKGLKNAIIVSVEQALLPELIHQLENTPYGYLVLHKGDKKSLTMLYHIERFRSYLSHRQILGGLKKYGYGVSEKKSSQENMMCALFELAERMQIYYAERQEFPHEIGYFLQYPIRDVEMFIRNDGRNCLMTGYWKVYQNVERAKATFAKYDEAKECAVADVMAGKMFYELAI